MHNEYLIASEKIQVEEKMLSNHCKKILKEYESSNGKVKRLTPSLSHKEEYVDQNLELYLRLGMKLTKANVCESLSKLQS